MAERGDGCRVTQARAFLHNQTGTESEGGDTEIPNRILARVQDQPRLRAALRVSLVGQQVTPDVPVTHGADLKFAGGVVIVPLFQG